MLIKNSDLTQLMINFKTSKEKLSEQVINKHVQHANLFMNSASINANAFIVSQRMSLKIMPLLSAKIQRNKLQSKIFN